jgi:RNA polymerase sigma-70 factor, ECF subfamily
VSNITPQQEPGERLNSFMELFLREQRRLYQFTVTLLANTADADDVFQETSLAIWSAFDQFEPGTDFYCWARQVAYHRVLRHRRQQHHGVRYLDPDVLELLAVDTAAPDSVAEVPVTALLDCMKLLSPSDRHLIDRCYSDDASGRQLADELHRPVNSIYKSLGRIRRVLMECVERTVTAQRREGEKP